MTNHGMAVNLYQIAKMFEENNIQHIREMMEESYSTDKNFKYGIRDYSNMTFEEYVNAKRNFLAGVLGIDKYL